MATTATERICIIDSEQEPGKEYVISRRKSDGRILCSCRDFIYRKSKIADATCKHIRKAMGATVQAVTTMAVETKKATEQMEALRATLDAFAQAMPNLQAQTTAVKVVRTRLDTSLVQRFTVLDFD